MKFSIITPAFNSESFIRETLESVIHQKGDFSIEHVVLDNCSTDGTGAIVKEYQDRLDAGTLRIECQSVKLFYFNERDDGMYDAISRGFARATGEIYAWINSDDVYLPGAFDIVHRTMMTYPQVEWLSGICPYMNKNSTIYTTGSCRLYRQDFVKAGMYGPILPFIQQESVFWTASLWQRSGGVNRTLALTGDYFLWRSFAEFTPLVSLNAVVSCFRKTATQKSAVIKHYFDEINATQVPEPRLGGRVWRYFARIERLPSWLRSLVYRIAFGTNPHYLVTLKNGVDPHLIEETDYFALKSIL